MLVAAETVAAAKNFNNTDRVMSTAPWNTADQLIDNMLAVFGVGASLVQVANAEPSAMQRRRETEKITRGLASA